MLALEINNTFGNNIDNHDFLGILPELYLLGVIINSLIISIKALGSNNNNIVHKKTHVISGVINKILENLNVLLFVWPFLYIDLHFGELIGTICNLINNPAIVEVEELSFERSFSGLSYFALNNAVAVSAYILFFKILVILTTSIILRSSVRYLRHHNKQLTEFITIILLVMFFLIVLISAQDLLVALVSIIGFSLNIYVLILSDSENQMAREAAIKYYYLSVFSSGLLAFGSWITYLLCLNTNFIDIAWSLQLWDFQEHTILLIAMLYFIIFGLFFKLAAFPCHLWAPAIYEGSPQVVTALFILPVKTAIIAFFFTLLTYVFKDLYFIWSFIVWFSSIFSMLFGCVAALFEKKARKFIAYSSINQMGFLLIGLTVGTFEGIRASLIYLLIYVLMNIGLFVILLNTYNIYTNRAILFLTDFTYLSKNNWLSSLTIIILLFSMAGIPPLAGFYGKYYLFLNAFETSYYSLVIIGMLTSMVSTFYYLKIIKLLWFERQLVNIKFITVLNWSTRNVLSLVEIFLVLFFLWNNFFFIEFGYITTQCFHFSNQN